jgi:uncharacterized protein YjbI with pentapeptide repeats
MKRVRPNQIDSVKARVDALLAGFSTALKLQVTLLSLCAYVIVVVGATTDEQLLRLSPVTLPLLNVSSPIQGFYVVTTWIIVSLHFYLLYSFHSLATELEALEIALRGLILKERSKWCASLFLQPLSYIKLSGKLDVRGRLAIVGLLLTTVLLPLCTLLAAEYRMVPFHGIGLTFTLAAAVVCSAVASTGFWPRIARLNSNSTNWLALYASFFIVVAALTGVAVMPGMPTAPILRARVGTWELWMFGKPKHLLDLKLSDLVLLGGSPTGREIDDLRYASSKDRTAAQRAIIGIDLEGRNLQFAQLDKTLLVKANLRSADLRFANLDGAVLDRARLVSANLHHANLTDTSLQATDLSNARLDGASLRQTIARGANFSSARLFGAHLDRADLTSTTFRHALLQGADMDKALLKGADLRHATIGGTSFSGADLTMSIVGDLDSLPLPSADFIRSLNVDSETAERLTTRIGKKANLRDQLEMNHYYLCEGDTCQTDSGFAKDSPYVITMCDGWALHNARDFLCSGNHASISLNMTNLEAGLDGLCIQALKDRMRKLSESCDEDDLLPFALQGTALSRK